MANLLTLPSSLRRLVWSSGSIPVCAVLLVLYLGVTAWGVHHHQPYRDEAQKWLLARDAGSLAEIGRRLPYEGTPGLWLLLLRPLARAGLPYASMNWLNWAVTGAAAALLLFTAPLPWHLKAAVLSSYCLLYQNPVFASNYSLSLLLLFAALALYRERRASPVWLGLSVALLANSSVLGALLAVPLAGVIAAEFLRVRPPSRRLRIGSALIAAGFVLMVLQIVPSRLGSGSSIENEFSNPYISSRRGLLSIAFEAFFPYVRQPWFTCEGLGVAGLLLLFLVAAGLWRRPKALVLLASSTTLLIFVLRAVASTGLRHTGFLFLAVVAALWMGGIERREAGAPPGINGESGGYALLEALGVGLVTLVAALSFPGAVERLRFEKNSLVSRARETAAVLRESGRTDSPIVAYPAGVTSGLLPYLPGTRFFYPGLGEYGTYVEQGERLWSGESALSADRVLVRALCSFPPGKRFTVLLGKEASLKLAPFCVGFHAPPAASESFENYWLFACDARAPDGSILPPRFCRP